MSLENKAYINPKNTRVMTHDNYEDNVSHGKYAKRRTYSKIDRQVEIPNLVAYQKDSYNRFLNEGIDNICKSIFPISDTKKKIVVNYKGFYLEDGKFSETSARVQSKNYEKKLFIDLDIVWNRVVDKSNKDITKEHNMNPIKSTKKDDDHNYSTSLYFGSIPVLTSKGNFIINGSNKIIIPQILKTPGSYFVREKSSSVGDFWVGRIQPFKGNWIDLTMKIDPKKTVNPIFIHFDRSGNKGGKRKGTPVTVFLKALGLTSDQMRVIYNKDDHIESCLDNEIGMDKEEKTKEVGLPFALLKLESVLEKNTIKAANKDSGQKLENAISSIQEKLFDKNRHTLAEFGRYQANQKLDIIKRLEGNYLGQDIKTKKGEVVVSKDELVHSETIKTLIERKSELDIVKKYKIEQGVLMGTSFEVSQINVYKEENNKEETKFTIIGPSLTKKRENTGMDIVDIISTISYLIGLNIVRQNKLVDDIDHLQNRRVRNIGELIEEQFNKGMFNVKKNLSAKLASFTEEDLENFSKIKRNRKNFFIHHLGILNTKPLLIEMKRFFNSSQLIQFMDQTNPIAEITNKRKVTALGPNGLDRRWSGEKVRDVHFTHYGRICPVETPEGANIGLIYSLPTFTLIDSFGFLRTPYWKVEDGKLLDPKKEDSIVYLAPNEEYSNNYVIASSNTRVSEDGEILTDNVASRKMGENIITPRENITHIDVSPKQVLSASASCIPFVENDDASRVLMASNMQRQAVPLMLPDSPIVGTGMEWVIARDASSVLTSRVKGKITYVDARKIVIEDSKTKELCIHKLSVFENNNQGTSTRHRPLVKVGDKVEVNDIIADGSATQNGELALGQNILVAFTTWYGYNFEDAIVVSSRLVKEDVYTSVHVIEYQVECIDTKNGTEEFTRDLPYASENAIANLDENGIAIIGTEVKENDILVGKVTPNLNRELTPEQQLTYALMGKKQKNVKDVSLRVPNGVKGIIQKAVHLKRSAKDGGIDQTTTTDTEVSSIHIQDSADLNENVNEVIKIYLIQKRKIQEGDKMAGRHGNKGVISIVLPEEDMPYLEDGTPIDILLSPLGIPSRMNIGQVLELHCGLAARDLGIKIATPVFEGMNSKDIEGIIGEANLDKSGKFNLYDGLTGKKFDDKVSIGIMYMMKLAHMVDDKIHARSTGPYSLVTQQPLGGKANSGGQRLGEMEVWALEAYGAAYTLKEMLTIKSDDLAGRMKTYRNIINGNEIVESGTPEALNVLLNELRGLAINVKLKENQREWPKREFEDDKNSSNRKERTNEQ